MPVLPRTEAAIADYRSHVSQFPETDPVILAYLIRHINGLMCAEIEQIVTELVCEKLGSGSSDAAVFRFFPNFLHSRRISSIRNARVDAIRCTVSSFGPGYQEKFDGLLRAANVDEQGVGKLNAAVQKRNANAHSIPPVITFEELEATVKIAAAVVETVKLTL